MLVAGALRFAVLERHPLWCDELATLQRLELPFMQHVRDMKGNHPLYELLLRLWMPSDGSDAWMRIPSAALGVLAVWLVWVMMRSLGRREALIAAWLLALSPLHLMYSRLARAYSLACTLTLLSNLSLMWAIKRRTFAPIAAYVLTTALMVYSNLFAGSILVAQGLLVLWFYRKRLRRLARWVAAYACIGLLLLPWMIFSLGGAAVWGAETNYTAVQYGIAAKACYLPLTLCLGETVHPLNLYVIIPAFIGFAAAAVSGLVRTVKRRHRIAILLLIQVVVTCALALLFSAAAPKHLTIMLPALAGLVAVGLAGMRHKWPAFGLGILIFATAAASDFNYFAGREFHDADMVTPWRKMAAIIKNGEHHSSDVLLIGYRPDPGAYDMFRRYYRAGGGKLDASYLFAHKEKEYPDIWKEPLERALRRGRTVWLLLHHGDPWKDVEAWLAENRYRFDPTLFQQEEHTLKGLREGWNAVGKYSSHLYRLYRIEPAIHPRKSETEP